MENKKESLDILKIDIDYRTTIKISGQILYYEQEYHSGGIEEFYEILLKNIKGIKFNEKKVNVQKTKESLFGNFFSTLLSSGAYPTSTSYDLPEIEVEHVTEKGVEYLKIKSQAITKDVYDKLNNAIFKKSTTF